MWQDMKMYWAWRGPYKDSKGKIIFTQPPTAKRLDYTTLRKGTPYEMKLCIGVWDDGIYTPLHRNELARLQGNKCGIIASLMKWLRAGKIRTGRNSAT